MSSERQAPRPAWVLVARLGRVRGLHGEIFGDGSMPSDRFELLKRIWVRREGGELLNSGEPLEIVELRPFKGRWVFRFAGIDSIDAAQRFEHCEVVIPETERPAVEEGEFYLSDLVGCVVFHRDSGLRLGTVTGWQQFGGPELLEVLADGASPGDVAWIPFARSICVEIDPANRRIVVDPPEGLLELNQARTAGPEPDR